MRYKAAAPPPPERGYTMTRAQETAVKRIRHLTDGLLFGDNFEIKEWEVEDCGSFVAVTVETGLKNDKGTMASILCRDRAHLFIGKRGGITYPVYRNGKQIQRRFNGYSLLSVVLEQNKDFYKG